MDVLGYFRTLLDIPSPSWKEDAVSSFIAMTMSSFGYQMIDDRAGNILFFLPVRGEKALISSHMDTVPLAETPHVIEDDAYFMTDGRTALGADNKATIAAMLKVAEESPDALFLFTRAEEIGLQGSKKITRDFLSPFNITRAYVPDAEGPVGTVITSAPGKEVLDIVFHGRTAHAGFSPESGINAIKAAAEAIAYSPDGRIDSDTTCNVGMISGGSATNTVPDTAMYRYEVRSLYDEKRRMISSGIISAAEKAASSHGCTVDITRHDLYSPYIIPEDSPAKNTAKERILSLGLPYSEKATSGGSDTNNIRALGIDTVTLTTGYEHPHSTTERIAKSELENLTRLISALVS